MWQISQPHNDKMELIIQKTTELGICKIKEFVIDKTGDMPTDFGSMQ